MSAATDSGRPAAAATPTAKRVAAALEGVEYRTQGARDGMHTVVVDRKDLADVLGRLQSRAQFEQATFITGVDHMPANPRFEVVHQLWSLSHRDRVRIKTFVTLEDPVVPTATHLWPGTAFMERECFDMFGIRFEGHENLRRLLMPEDYEHFPLRKEFPHHGIEPDKLYRAWEKGRREEFFERQSAEKNR